MTRARDCAGFTFIEMLVASVIAAVVAGGTMAAFVTAGKITRAHNAGSFAEAEGYALQTAEQFRNMISCAQPADLNAWFDGSANCLPTLNIPTAWTTAQLPPGGGTTKTIQNSAAVRRYRVTEADCDEDGAAGDCLQMSVKVCWDGANPGACP